MSICLYITLQEAEKSVARRKNVMLAKEDLKFEKSLELASKNLKDAEEIPKVDISNEGLYEKLEKAKQQSSSGVMRDIHSTNTNGHNNNTETKQLFVRRSKPPQRQELTLPFIQNRDSIHWDADTDSDEDAQQNKDRPFIDVTESSAFTVVPSRTSQSMVRTNPHVSPSDRPQWRAHHVSIPNGKVYTPPKQSVRSPPDDARRRDLQEQCQKLQELQRHHRLTPTIQTTRAPTNTPNNTPTLKPVPYSTTPLSRNLMSNGKPTIAPKPQALRNKLSASMMSRPSDQDSNSSTDSDSEHALKEAKSTTV